MHTWPRDETTLLCTLLRNYQTNWLFASSYATTCSERVRSVYLCEEVDNGVGQNVVAGGAREKEGPPPPVVVLPTQLEVGHDYGHLRAGNDQDDEDEEEEPKQVVELVFPDCLYRIIRGERGWGREREKGGNDFLIAYKCTKDYTSLASTQTQYTYPCTLVNT